MKISSLLLLLTAATLSAFAGQKSKKKPAAKEIVSVGIYHTACFGRCAEFKININRNGTATYTGIRFVPDSGTYTKKIGKRKAKEIIDQFRAFHVDTCQDHYESRIQDLPGVVMTINYSRGSKTIQNSHFGPPVLKMLTTKVDSVIHRQYNDEGGLLPIDGSWHKVTGTRK